MLVPNLLLHLLNCLVSQHCPDLEPFDLGQLSVRPFTGGCELGLTRWQRCVYTFELVIRLVTMIFK